MGLRIHLIPTEKQRTRAMSLKETLSTYWLHVQEELLPWLNDTTCGPLNEHHKQLITVLGMARIEAFLPGWPGLPGRPLSERSALARAFVAKAVFNFSTTRLLIEMLTRRYAGCAVGSARARYPVRQRFLGPSPNSPRALCHHCCTRR
jgi:hypothetical protein